MALRIAHVVSIAFVVAATAGCRTSAPARFYTLASTASTDGAPAANYAVTVGPVSVPASVDRPQFVVQVAPNRVVLDEFNRWVAPLDESIARAVAGNLAVLLGTPRVATAPLANFDPAYRVTIAVQRFDSIPGDAVVIDAVWTIRNVANGGTRSGRTVAREAVQGEGFEALAAAHSRALANVSGDIAAAIRAEAGSHGVLGVAR
ncbi:MAG: membrane integrity-associated transporter subunit PqiC [Deltaproteobacteria bacterium]|nr:MAG: membrane integrity-associated transporter subunit PqiC [Deltaproteobacteria bacterium]